jgi:hypothetical protein
VGTPARGQQTTSSPMKIEVNIHSKDTPLVAFILGLLEKPELWKMDGKGHLDGPHDIALGWDNFPVMPFFTLRIKREQFQNIGFLEKWQIIRAANKVQKFLKKVEILAEEKRVEELVKELISKGTEAKS